MGNTIKGWCIYHIYSIQHRSEVKILAAKGQEDQIEENKDENRKELRIGRIIQNIKDK